MENLELLGKYDFDKNTPSVETTYNVTFSVGIFQWQLKNNKKALKKGKIIIRVCGMVENKENVFAKATKVANELNNGKAIMDFKNKIIV